MEEKICFKCGDKKPLSKFYPHPQMTDGHLNKCIDCTKKDTKNSEKNLRKNKIWVESEKKRNREKYYRLNYREKHKPSYEMRVMANKKHKEKYPEKQLAKNHYQHLKCKKGNQLHHWSYNKEHWKDVIEISVTSHSKLHRYMVYDQERMMYRRCDTMELLDTKELHLKYFEEIKNNP